MSDERQHWDPERYAANARFVSDLGMPVVDLLAPKPGERVLDLGCGDGALTVKLIDLGCRVIAVDGSAEQVEAARALGIDARVERAERMPFQNEFDAVFSNAVLHWVKDADAALAGVYRALRAGGRFAAELGGYGCVNHIRTALHAGLAGRGVDPARFDPWYFPSDAEYGARLRAAGFEIRSIALFPRPTPLPGDVTGWLETFAQPFLAALVESERPAFLAEVRERLRPVLSDAYAAWTADYVRLRLLAVKPS
jgi:trans-aconitate methyltransferase